MTTLKNDAKMIGLAGAIGLAVFLAMSAPAFASAQYLAEDQSVTTPKNLAKAIQLGGSAPDDFYFVVVNGTQNGYLEYDGMTGAAVYHPNMHFVGQDSFTFEVHSVNNNTWCCDYEGTVTIDVQQSAGSGGKNWSIARAAAETLKTMESIPESTTGVTLDQAVTGPLGFNLMSAAKACEFAGFDYQPLTDGQKVWLMENYNALMAEGMGN